MKKHVALLLSLILTLTLCACNDHQAPNDDSQQSQSESNLQTQTEGSQQTQTENNQQTQTEDNQQTQTEDIKETQTEDNQETQTEDIKETQTEEAPQKTEFKLTVFDYWGYLAHPLEEYYDVGEQVEVEIIFLSGPLGGINVNGVEITDREISDTITSIYTFTMPAKDSVLYTTMNGNIGFISTFSYADGFNYKILIGGLNNDKVESDRRSHLPIYKFDTLSDLEKFKSDFGGQNGFNYGWDEVPSFNDATKYYDDAFFEENTLMLVYIHANNCSVRFAFNDISIKENSLCIYVEKTYPPAELAEAEASWFITVTVPDSMIAECTEFDAILDMDISLSSPFSNLQYWIAENADNYNFSSCQEKYGMFGGREYYGRGYVPTINENGEQVDPEHCVIYTVTSYPDYSDKTQHITGIYITDPEITFYDISLNSSFDDFERLITQEGFKITDSNENSRTAEKGKYSIIFTKEWIRIRVEVKNKYGIIY